MTRLRRRQVQGKVYIRWGEYLTCCQLWEQSQGRRWEAQERREMIHERRWVHGMEDRCKRPTVLWARRGRNKEEE